MEKTVRDHLLAIAERAHLAPLSHREIILMSLAWVQGIVEEDEDLLREEVTK